MGYKIIYIYKNKCKFIDIETMQKIIEYLYKLYPDDLFIIRGNYGKDHNEFFTIDLDKIKNEKINNMFIRIYDNNTIFKNIVSILSKYLDNEGYTDITIKSVYYPSNYSPIDFTINYHYPVSIDYNSYHYPVGIDYNSYFAR